MKHIELKDLSVGDLAVFHCFDGSTIEVEVTEINDALIYGKSQFGNHWADIKDVERIAKNN